LQAAAILAAAAAAGGTRDQEDTAQQQQQQNTVHMSTEVGVQVVIGMPQALQAISMMRHMVAAAAGIGGRVGTEMTGVMTVITTEGLTHGRLLDQRVSHQGVGICSSRGSGKGEGTVQRWGIILAVVSSSSSSMAGGVMNRTVVAVAAILLLLLAVAAVMHQVLRILEQQEVLVGVLTGQLKTALQAWVLRVAAVQQQAVLLLLPLLLLLTVNFALL
jgi:hypothetical protein